jgi:DnaJ-class molecular chaperone
MEIEMSEQTKDCEACFGTGNDVQVRSPYPIRKILFHPCPTCEGTGKVPDKQNR